MGLVIESLRAISSIKVVRLKFESMHDRPSTQSAGIVSPDHHPLLSTWPENPENRRNFHLNYFEKFPEEDLKISNSDAIAIVNNHFKIKLKSIAGRKQIRLGRPAKANNL